MSSDKLSVRELQAGDIALITAYWLGSDEAYLTALGVDITKMPTREEWKEMLLLQLSQRIEEKSSYCIIWQVNDEPVGHSNINRIIYSDHAYMHIHLWNRQYRKGGNGTELIKLTLPWFFKNYNLQTLYCEPYALNAAANKTLQKVGFEFVKQYTTTPGWLNFEQEVKLWALSRARFVE